MVQATLDVELRHRPRSLIGGETGDWGGISAIAALSLVAGVINAVFKIAAGWHQYKKGPLDAIGAQDRKIQ